MNSLLALLATLASLNTTVPEPVIEPGRTSAAPNVTYSKSMSVAIFPAKDHSHMNLMVENHAQIPLWVRFVNDRKEVLYSIRVARRHPSFQQKFWVENLKDGKYGIEVSDGFNKILKEFTIASKKPEPASPTRWFTALNE